QTGFRRQPAGKEGPLPLRPSRRRRREDARGDERVHPRRLRRKSVRGTLPAPGRTHPFGLGDRCGRTSPGSPPSARNSRPAEACSPTSLRKCRSFSLAVLSLKGRRPHGSKSDGFGYWLDRGPGNDEAWDSTDRLVESSRGGGLDLRGGGLQFSPEAGAGNGI